MCDTGILEPRLTEGARSTANVAIHFSGFAFRSISLSSGFSFCPIEVRVILKDYLDSCPKCSCYRIWPFSFFVRVIHQSSYFWGLKSQRKSKLTQKTMFSTCTITGHFTLSHGSRVAINNRFRAPFSQFGVAENCTFYAFYDTTVTCLDNSFAIANIRVPSSVYAPIVEDDTIALITGTIFVQTGDAPSFIDATDVKVIPAEASSFFPPTAAFFVSHLDCLGKVCGEAYVLQDRSIVFPVAISVYVRNEMKSCQLM